MSIMSIKFNRIVPAIAAGVLAFASPLYAFDFSEGSFEEGSFNDAPQEPAAAPESSQPATGDGFDQGSFNDDGSAKPVSTTEPSSPTPEPQAPPDDTTVVEEREPEPTGTQDQAETTQTETITVDPQIYAFETRDHGVPGQTNLRGNPLSGPTPLDLPGGYIVSTQGMVDAYLASTDMIVIDVLGNEYGLPDAFVLRNLANPGHFNDRIQQQASIWLNNVTGGDASYPIVVYCSDPQCWLSYNGALRVIAAGYSNVYWYRGGVRAWEMAGLTVYPTGF